MTELDIRLRSYLRLVAIGSGSLAADAARVQRMVEAFLAAPALAAATKAKVGDRAAKKVPADQRASLAASGKHARIEYFDLPNPKRGAWIQVTVGDSEIDIDSAVERQEMAKHRATALDDLVAAFKGAIEVWHDATTVRHGFIKAEYLNPFPPYARLRFPRVNGRYPERSLVTFLDRRNTAWGEDVNALLHPLPAHATITSHDEVVEIRWAKTLGDGEIAQASTWHDCWVRRSVTTPDRDFNAHGDERVRAGDATQEPPLTLYNPWHKRGFKAVLVTPEGELEESAWEDARAILKAKALPSGAEVSKLWVVVPLREHAIAVHEQVVAAGFEAAVYPGDEGDFWDPLPKGPWLTESTDNGSARS